MASGSNSSVPNSMEEMKAALMKAQAELKASMEQNMKLTESESVLRKELESAKSSHKSNRRSLAMDPCFLDFGEEPLTGDNQSDEEAEEDALPNLGSDIATTLLAQNRKLMRMIHKIPGAPVPVDVEAIDGYSQSPFVEDISKAQIPERLNIPAMPKLYDGTTDPLDHVAQYKQRMWQLSIPQELMEATLCKSFGATLCGPALQWLIHLKPNSISNFAGMVNKFYQQFSSSRDI